MIIDVKSLPDNETLETDICIIGGGVAGITLAREFIGQQFKVCLLESGGLEPSREIQSLNWGENIGFPYYQLDFTRIRGMGGSSHSWDIAIGENSLGVRLRPLDAIDFEERDWVEYSGWPFEKAHLDPYYQRAHSHLLIENSSFDIQVWEDPAQRPLLPMNSERIETIIYKFGDREIFTQHPRDQISNAENISAFINATVLEIDANNSAQSVSRVLAGSLNGNRFWISAKYFILALGGLETPRLLLLSNKTQQSGVGNQHDLVGRYFMEHLHYWTSIHIPSQQEIFRMLGLYSHVQTVHRVPIIGKLALSEKVIRNEQLLNQNIQIFPVVLSKESYYDTFLYPRFPAESLGGKATNAYRAARRAFARIFRGKVNGIRFANMTEQIPNPNSRVTLSEDQDEFGQNRIKLDWQLTAQDILSSERTQEIIGTEFVRIGKGKFFNEMKGSTPPESLHGGHHHMGTTRMHTNPKLGVVDENCKVHGISNLYIAGPSVFPTGGYANPVLTILAMAIRLADYMKGILN